MKLKGLTILNLADEKVYRDFRFNESGLNVILGQKSLESDETNGVGKTAIIECIRYCLGASLPKCFKDKPALAKHNIFVALDIEINGFALKLGRILYDDTYGYTIASGKLLFRLDLWDMYESSNYREYIENLALGGSFGLQHKAPSFASIREYLMRDEKTGFQGITLSGRNAVQNSKILNFLSLLPTDYELKLGAIKSRLKDLQNQLKDIKAIGKEIKTIKQQHTDTLEEIKSLNQMLTTADISGKISFDNVKYASIKNRLEIVLRDIHILEHAKEQHAKSISNLDENVKKAKEIIDLKSFYSQLLGYFPDKLSKNYDDMASFYDYMTANRGQYFREQISSISGKLGSLYVERNACLEELSSCTEFMRNTEVGVDLRDISKKLNEKYQLVATYLFKIEQYEKRKSIEEAIRSETDHLEEMATALHSDFASYDKTINNIIQHYHNLNNIAYKEMGDLDYVFEDKTNMRANTGRIKITCSLPDEGAYGRFLMKINMFDISLLLNRVDNHNPLLFLVHDGSYSKPAPSIKGDMLVSIDKYLKQRHRGQYFISVNTEELDSADLDRFRNMGAIVAELERTESNEKRSIGIKY